MRSLQHIALTALLHVIGFRIQVAFTVRSIYRLGNRIVGIAAFRTRMDAHPITLFPNRCLTSQPVPVYTF